MWWWRRQVMATELIIDFEDATTKAELAEAITNICFRARREMPVVGTPRAPTPWDRRHQELNRLLDEYERAPA